MTKHLVLVSLFLIVYCSSAVAQLKGCLIGSTTTGTLYTQKNSLFTSLYITSSGGYPTSPPACPRVLLGTPTGASCGFTIFTPTAYTEYNYTLLTAPVGCALDSCLILVIGVLGIYGIRRMRG
ncbi:hypothetical protein [Pedobacter sp.]|uniref:hypothetical protein n=1 Tax=Pedobacter sp. TaxID=1411316 RepID=UPI003BA88110